MSLNVDWNLIGYAADPVPGDPDGVEVCAKRLMDKKATVDSLVGALNDIVPDKGGSVFAGDAADQYARKLSHFPEDMKHLSQGLEKAYGALNSWKSGMKLCQDDAYKAYNDAKQALETKHAAQHKLDSASASARSAHSAERQMRFKQLVGVDIPKADEKETVSRVQRAEQSVANFRSQVNSAQDSYLAAMKRLESTSDEYTKKARSTRASLQGSLEDLPSASWWEKVYYSSAWSVVVKVAEIGGLIFGVAALVLGGGGVIGILAFAFAAIGFINDSMALAEHDESRAEFGLSLASLLLAGAGGVSAVKGLSKGLQLFRSGGKSMSVLSKLRLLGDPTQKGGYLVSHFSKMLGKENGILPISKWAKEAKSLAAASSKTRSIPLLWMKGFGNGVWSSAKATGKTVYNSTLYTYAKFENEGLKFISRDAGEAAAKVKIVVKNDGLRGALRAVQKNPLYGTVSNGIRSVIQDNVDAVKRQVHNSEQKSGGWKTTVSEGLGYLKPVSPIAGPLGSVLAKV